MMNDRQFEESLKGIFEENITENGSSAEIDVEKLLESAYREAEIENNKKDKLNKKSKRIKKIRAAIIFVGIIIVSLAVFGPEQGYADIFRFMMNKVGADGNVVQDNLIGYETEDEDVINNMIKMEELDDEVGFHVVIPKYLEDNYEMLADIQLTKVGDQIVSIMMQFGNFQNEKYLLYRIMNVENKKCNSSKMDVPSEGIEIIKNDGTINYCYYRDEENMRGRVYWQDYEYLYYIDGNINKDEAVDIVESLK